MSRMARDDPDRQGLFVFKRLVRRCGSFPLRALRRRSGGPETGGGPPAFVITTCPWEICIDANFDSRGGGVPHAGCVMSAIPASSTSCLTNPTSPYMWLLNFTLTSLFISA
jgi:hypothetical protein